MITDKWIKQFLDNDKRFAYEILKDNTFEVFVKNTKSTFTITKAAVFGVNIVPDINYDNGILKVAFNNIYNMTAFAKVIETIYKAAIVSNEKEKVIKYPIGGNVMFKQTINRSNDFLNDYKVIKLAERAINNNFAELTEAFFNFSNSEEELETILSCGNSKVLFFAHGSNRKIIIEFGQDGEEPFRYTHTNNGINLLNDYDPKALITIGNLIESAVDTWLEDDENRIHSINLNDRMLSLVDNIKNMISLINTTIGKYNV